MDETKELIPDDVMYEGIDDENYERADFEEDLEFLVQKGLILRFIFNCEYGYSSAPGLDWQDSRMHLITPRQRELLLQLVDAPKTKSFLYNTQKGKSEYSSQVLKSWSELSKLPPNKRMKIIGIVILSNDQTLGDQSIGGVLAQLGRSVEAKDMSGDGVYPLMSQYKVIESNIQMYCDAYRGDNDNEYEMPLIFALNNPSQRAKIQRILTRLERAYRSDRESLCAAMLFDECDETYPAFREMVHPLLTHENDIIHEVQFVTATDGTMMEDYEEYRYAKSILQPINDNEPYYRSIHHENSVVRSINPNTTKRQLAFDVIQDNIEYFRQEVRTISGGLITRKVIVNGSNRGADHVLFATEMNRLGFNALTFNMLGVRLYRAGRESPITFKTKGRRLNELLYYIYKVFELESRPLFIIGCRKVDRGLGFHYAPRSHQEIKSKTVNFGHGDLTFNGSNGLVFTDMILGQVTKLSTAAQKSGRLDGIVGQCPDCPVTLTWWTDELTEEKVVRHKRRVDATHQLPPGAYSSEQAKHAAIRETRQDGDYTITHGFLTREEAHQWASSNIKWERVLNGAEQPIHRNSVPWDVTFIDDETRTHIHDHGSTLGKLVSSWNQLDQSNISRFGQGVRCIPVLYEDQIRYVVSYKVGWL